MMITLTDVRILLDRHKWKLLVLPLLAALAVYIFMSRKGNTYTSNSVLFTGIASSYKISGDNNEATKEMKPDMAIADMLIIINSRETKKQIALSLLAQHLMLPTYNPSVISNENLDRLKKILPETLRSSMRGSSFEDTKAKLQAYNDASTSNEIYRLLHSEDPVYSFAALEKISVYQLPQSEMFQIDYSSGDPAVSQQTLIFLNDIFLKKQQSLYAPQTATVINYFDSASRQAYIRLQQAEQTLADFNKTHGILDYDQQLVSSSEGKQTSADEYNKLQMQYSGTQATIQAAESALKKRGVSNLESQEIIALRNQLSDVSTQIANIEMMGSNSDADAQKRLVSLKQTAASLSGQIKNKVDAYYHNANTAQGMPVDGLVEDYVRNTMTAAQQRSQLSSANQQRATASNQASQLAPLAPEIRRMKREIDLAQQDYLSKVEGLKQSRLTQENMNLAANQVKVLDPPNFPIRPSNKSKLPLLVLLTLFGTFLLTSSIIGTQYVLSNGMKSPASATAISGLPVMSILPVPLPDAHHQKLMKQAVHQLGRQLLLQYKLHTPLSGPFLVGIASHFQGEGKSLLLPLLQQFLKNAGLKTIVCLPEGHLPVSNLADVALRYQATDTFKAESFNTLVGNFMKDAEVALVEFPAMLEADYPVALAQEADMLLLAVKFGRSWKEADSNIISGLQKLRTAPVGLVMTHAPELYVAEHTGVEINPFDQLWQRVKPASGKMMAVHSR
jgi:hypothetical protein